MSWAFLLSLAPLLGGDRRRRNPPPPPADVARRAVAVATRPPPAAVVTVRERESRTAGSPPALTRTTQRGVRREAGAPATLGASFCTFGLERAAEPYAFTPDSLWRLFPREAAPTFPTYYPERDPSGLVSAREPHRPHGGNEHREFITEGREHRVWFGGKSDRSLGIYIERALSNGNRFIQDASKWQPAAAQYVKVCGLILAKWDLELRAPLGTASEELWRRALSIECKTAGAAFKSFHQVSRLASEFENVGQAPTVSWRPLLRDAAKHTDVNAAAAWYAGALRDARTFASEDTARSVADRLVSDDIPGLREYAEEVAVAVWRVAADLVEQELRAIVDMVRDELVSMADEYVSGLAQALPAAAGPTVAKIAAAFYAAVASSYDNEIPTVTWNRWDNVPWRLRHLDAYMHMMWRSLLVYRARLRRA